jgi:hypothetical protein
MNRKRVMRWLAYGATGLAVLGAVAVGALALWVRQGVSGECRKACAAEKMEYPRQQAEALIAYVRDARTALREKDRAVWAMGYVKDARVLAALRGMVANGGQCDHGRYVCQYEVKKAIDKQTGARKVAPMLLARR